jgi:hypothetical protein
MSSADRAAHAAGSHVRSFLSVAGEEALRRSYAATQRILSEEYDAALVERGLAEYRAYADGVAA